MILWREYRRLTLKCDYHHKRCFGRSRDAKGWLLVPSDVACLDEGITLYQLVYLTCISTFASPIDSRYIIGRVEELESMVAMWDSRRIIACISWSRRLHPSTEDVFSPHRETEDFSCFEISSWILRENKSGLMGP